jgi:N6-L-threonylcarbamoyladenine synthase
VVIAGGVAASGELRRQVQAAIPFPVEYPDMKLCTDNGAMIAFAAAQRVQRGMVNLDVQDHGFNVSPRWDLASL